ncbi:MAG: DUF3303 family protein [Anaerolineales bacterium]|nr:DUF3303 family protein [Anaerolineales bacterium]
MKYMIIERYHQGAKDAIYERYAAKGRMMPEGLHYLDSWLTVDGQTCYQLMETEHRDLFEQWMKHWNDLVRLDIIPVVDSPTKSTDK